MAFAFLIVGLAVGAGAVWALARTQIASLGDQLARERTGAQEKVALIARENAAWEQRFEELSAKALQRSNESFLQLAGTKLAPIESKLSAFDEHTRALEVARQGAYSQLSAQVHALGEAQRLLRAETGNLVSALRTPDVRGRWGEMQLQRTVESAGMLERCDFLKQETAHDDGRRLRPDLIVKLPGGRNVVVDAKVPLQALLDALDETLTDEARGLKLDDFKRHVRDHVTKLSAKGYWQQFSPTPDFVVMFLPGESFYREAIRLDPELLELDRRVIIASPTILITLLRAIAVGWREEKVAESARAVSELGRELYDRLATMTGHFVTLGNRLDGAVQAYNKTVGSLERRVMVTARQFPDHGITTEKTIAELEPIDKSSQLPQTIELPRAADAA
jgi:DNA recombination protein RmuC